jgi:hypothetical protein
MIHDGTHDQDLYNEQKGLRADAEAPPGKTGEIVPAPPQGDGWVAEAVTAVEASITKLIDEFRVQPFIHRVEHSLHIRLVQLLGEWEHLRGWYPKGDSGFSRWHPELVNLCRCDRDLGQPSATRNRRSEIVRANNNLPLVTLRRRKE